MKKIVFGIIIGAVLMSSGQALADSISKVGKKVQGEVVVKVNGVELEVKGLVVDGQTNVPARAFADASGFDIAFENKEVLLTKKGGEVVTEPTKEEVGTADQTEEYTLETITSIIYEAERGLHVYRTLIKASEVDGTSEEDLNRLRNEVKKQEKELEKLKAIKTQLEADAK